MKSSLKSMFHFLKISLLILLLFNTGHALLAENFQNFSCSDILRLRNDSYFFMEGIGAWKVLLGERRRDLKNRGLHEMYVTTKRQGELFVYQEKGQEGVIGFKGSFIDYIIVFLLSKDEIKKRPGVFYYSCMGFTQEELLTVVKNKDYLKKIYQSKSYDINSWIFFPYKGIAFYFNKNRIKAFMVFKRIPLSKGFDYKKFYNFKIY